MQAADPYFVVSRGLVDGKHRDRLREAVWLFLFLIDRQTDPEGRVNYGKPISYAWIETRFANCPPRRTIERWMDALKDGEYIRVRRVPFGGLVVTIVAQKKWRRSAQLPLFPRESPLSINRGKAFGDAEEKRCKTSSSLPPQMAAGYRHKWRNKDSKEVREEKNKTAARASAYPFPAGKPQTEPLTEEEARDEFFRELRRLATRGGYR